MTENARKPRAKRKKAAGLTPEQQRRVHALELELYGLAGKPEAAGRFEAARLELQALRGGHGAGR